jgi:ABC-2 type transport system ATP-binding protein
VTAVQAPLPAAALETRNLSKAYLAGHLWWQRRVPAVWGLSLRVERGEVFGFLGPNGSGKTTTLKMLMGLLHPDEGEASILGVPLADPSWRFRTGYLPEHPYLYDYLTAREYLDYVGRLFGMAKGARGDRARALLEEVGLSRSADVPLRRFSKGMLQRAGLAQALMNDPELIVLDEPMSGLDPIGRRLVRNIILGRKAAGKTVFFSTHILTDAETLCDRVAVVRGGRLLDSGPLARILQVDVSHLEVLVGGLEGAPLDAPGIRQRQVLGERLRLEVDEGALAGVVQAVEEKRGRILSVQPIRQSLEDYFFKEIEAGSAPPVKGVED